MNAAQEHKVGQIVEFLGYTETPPDGAILTKGQKVKIEKLNDDGGMVVLPADGTGPGDTVFPEEVKPVEAAAASAPATAPASAPAAAQPTTATETKTDTKAAKPKAEKKAKTAKAAKAEKKAEKKGKAKAKKADAPKADEKSKQVEEAASRAPSTTTSPQITDTEAVRNALSGQDALAAAKALVNRVEENYFTLGGVLHHIYVEGLHKAAGFDGKRGFAMYVEKELGVAYRKAMYLIEIYQTFRILGVDEQRLGEIGWSKAKELKRVRDSMGDERLLGDFDSLVDFAKGHSREELISHLKDTYVTGQTGTGTERVRKSQVRLSLFADQAETFQRATEAAKRLTGSDDLAVQVEHIMGEWLQMTEGVELDIETALRALETRFKVRLSVANEAGEAQPRPERQSTQEASAAAQA